MFLLGIQIHLDVQISLSAEMGAFKQKNSTESLTCSDITSTNVWLWRPWVWTGFRNSQLRVHLTSYSPKHGGFDKSGCRLSLTFATVWEPTVVQPDAKGTYISNISFSFFLNKSSRITTQAHSVNPIFKQNFPHCPTLSYFTILTVLWDVIVRNASHNTFLFVLFQMGIKSNKKVQVTQTQTHFFSSSFPAAWPWAWIKTLTATVIILKILHTSAAVPEGTVMTSQPKVVAVTKSKHTMWWCVISYWFSVRASQWEPFNVKVV